MLKEIQKVQDKLGIHPIDPIAEPEIIEVKKIGRKKKISGKTNIQNCFLKKKVASQKEERGCYVK